MKKSSNPVTATVLAALHGVSTRMVQKWRVAGMPRRPDGLYDPAATIRWRLDAKCCRRCYITFVET
jgi:phage terminase Nu1 subunit (DNA packaging protein)